MPLTLHSWRRRDPYTGRWRVLRWKMTEDDARRWAAREGASAALAWIIEGFAGPRETTNRK